MAKGVLAQRGRIISPVPLKSPARSLQFTCSLARILNSEDAKHDRAGYGFDSSAEGSYRFAGGVT